MSKFGSKALRQSVLRQKIPHNGALELSAEQRSQTHPDARVWVGCVFLVIHFCDFC